MDYVITVNTSECYIRTVSLDIANGFVKWISGDIEFAEFAAIVRTHAPQVVDALPGLVETCMGTAA